MILELDVVKPGDVVAAVLMALGALLFGAGVTLAILRRLASSEDDEDVEVEVFLPRPEES